MGMWMFTLAWWASQQNLDFGNISPLSQVVSLTSGSQLPLRLCTEGFLYEDIKTNAIDQQAAKVNPSLHKQGRGSFTRLLSRFLPKALLGAPLAGTCCRVQSCPGKSWIALSLSDFSQFPQPSRLLQLVQAINKTTNSSDKPAVHKHCRGWSLQGSLPPGSPT